MKKLTTTLLLIAIFLMTFASCDLGDIILMKENCKNKSCCCQNEDRFDYHGIKNALYGKTGFFAQFTPKRILVIQMK